MVNLRLIIVSSLPFISISNKARPIDMEVIVFQICWHSINVSPVIIIISCRFWHIPRARIAYRVRQTLIIDLVSNSMIPDISKSYINFYKSKIIRVGRHSLSNSSRVWQAIVELYWFSGRDCLCYGNPITTSKPSLPPQLTSETFKISQVSRLLLLH